MNNCYYIIRQGESVLNAQGRHQGQITGSPLTSKGKIQAQEAAEKLTDKSIDYIFASPLLRTRQTAEIIAEKLNLPVNFSDDLKEHHQSKSWEGFPADKYKKLPSHLLTSPSLFTKRFSLEMAWVRLKGMSFVD